MKIKPFLICLILFAAVFSLYKIVLAKGTSDTPSSISLPYVVEIKNQDGTSEEIKGLSLKNDPFLIAEELSAGPFKEDKISIFPEMKMGIGGKITITRAPVFQIRDGKRSKEVRSWQKTVGELLSEQKIELGADDKINFALDFILENGAEIVIKRVAITTVIEPEVIEYKTVKKSNPNIEKGNKKTLQSGENGKRSKYYLVTREDGEEISRQFTKSEVAKEPVDEIIEVGTKVVVYGSGVASIWKSSPEMISACNFVKKGTMAHVINLDNGKSVDVTCMGGGLRSDRIVDLSDAAFQKLGGSWSQGLLKNVRVEKYYPE